MKRLAGILITLGVFTLIIGFIGYKWIYVDNTSLIEPYELYIPSGSGFDDVSNQLEGDSVLKNPESFYWVARLMKYDRLKVPSGKYIIEPGMSNKSIVTILRASLQTPISLIIVPGRTINDAVGNIAGQVEADSTDLINLLTNEKKLSSLGFNRQTIVGMIIPNTYEIYWNIRPEVLIDRLKKEYDQFWTASRRAKLEEINLDRNECSTLASIVEKETNIAEEKPIIAGLYLNRLKNNILLQADPTVVFGVGDFTIRRVLNKHLAHDSPYNTYLNPGLPPGPIYMPSISSIDAVLNAEKHDYIFMCSKPGYNGAHVFAETNRQHEVNAAIYHRWLNSENIKK